MRRLKQFAWILTVLILSGCAGLQQDKHTIEKPEIPVAKDVVAEHGMVASAHPVASQVGVDILKQGGNAVDAAAAVMCALSIAESNASGIGGGGFMVVKMADREDAVMLDYRETAPRKATPEFYYNHPEKTFDELTEYGPYAMGVPGAVAGAELALEKFGTMTLKQVLQPSIRLSREGIVVSGKLHGMIVDNYEILAEFPPTAAIYLKDMLPLEEGDLLINEDLARTFEKIAEHGTKVFYEGEIAEAIVNEIQKWGGIIELEDMKYYEVKIRKAVEGYYRGYLTISTAPPSGGGTFLVELLNIMEGYDVKAMGHNSVEFIHIFAEAMKIVHADKANNLADPDFFDVPVDTFINKKYAERVRKRINKKHADFSYEAPQLIRSDSQLKSSATESNETSHLSIIDVDGNIVVLTQSIDHWFGCGIVASGTGVVLNTQLDDFDNKPNLPNSIGSYKRPTSNIAATILLKDGKPFIAVGTPGGNRIISALAQIIMNVVDHGMSMDEAIEAPRVYCLTKILHVERRISEKVIEKLRSMGHDVNVRENFDKFFGGAQGILIDPITHKLHGGADSRRDGVAIGY